MYSQVTSIDSISKQPLNAAANALMGNRSNNISFGVYGQIDYNQPIEKGVKKNGTLDVHRLVAFMGYNFNESVSFVTEIEIEHVDEIYVEQAFLNYNFNSAFNFKAGLILVPMGIINEYHEPTTFNGVERPGMDSKLVPTTWREMGAGLSGNLSNLSLKYQVYVVNGFNGYNGDGKLNGSNGLRSGRQKGSRSYMTSPNLSSKLDYYGIRGLKIGLSSYVGKSQSTLFNNIDTSNSILMSEADSSVVKIMMVGSDFRYTLGGLTMRGQYIKSKIMNTYKYNVFTDSDLGSSMRGYYIELAYDLIKLLKVNTDKRLDVFCRFEDYNLQQKMEGDLLGDKQNHHKDLTIGLGLHVAQGAVIKADYQHLSNATKSAKKQINLGIGIWF